MHGLLTARPRVSVLMTAWNPGTYLRDALESLWQQTFVDFEVILIDDGTTDGSLDEPRVFADPRLRVHRLGRHIGRTPALRHGFDLAVGEYIAVLDADDMAHADRFEKEVAFLDANPGVAVVATWCRLIDPVGKTMGAWDPPGDPAAVRDSMGFVNPIMHSSAMFRRAAAELAGGYPAAFPYAQDFALWLAMLDRGAIAILPEYLASIRLLSTSMTRGSQSQLAAARDSLILFEQAARDVALSEAARRANRRTWALSAIRYGMALMRNHRPVTGIGWIARGLARSPLTLIDNNAVRRFIGRDAKRPWN